MNMSTLVLRFGCFFYFILLFG